MLQALVPRDVIGFCYHTVSDRPLSHVQSLYRCKSVAQFKRDLEFLQRSYRVVGYDDLERTRSAPDAKKPSVVVTFDDGLVECHDVVRPVLLEYGVPAIFFVTADFLDNRRLFYRQKIALCIESYSRLSAADASKVRQDVAPLFGAALGDTPQLLARLHAASFTEEPAIDATCSRLGIDTDEFLRTVRPYLTGAQVRALASDGFTIGAHGMSHRLMGTMTEAEARADIIAACDSVSTLVPAAPVPFAFPFNGRGVSREMLRALRASRPQLGLFFDSTELARDWEFVVNRLVVDDPAGAAANGSNLPSRLRRAYAREIVRPLVGRFVRSG